MFEEWWDFTSMYPQVKFRNSCLTSSVFGALLAHWTFYGPSNGGLFRLVYLPCLSQMERRDGFITVFVIPLLGSHAWGQSLEISLKELYIRTVAPSFNASTVYCEYIQNIFTSTGNGRLESTFKVHPFLFSWMPFSVSWLKVGPRGGERPVKTAPFRAKGGGKVFISLY